MKTKDYTTLSLEELKAERMKLNDRHGDEPVRTKFLIATLDALIQVRSRRVNGWVIRDGNMEYSSLLEWRARHTRKTS